MDEPKINEQMLREVATRFKWPEDQLRKVTLLYGTFVNADADDINEALELDDTPWANAIEILKKQLLKDPSWETMDREDLIETLITMFTTIGALYKEQLIKARIEEIRVDALQGQHADKI